MHHAGREVPRTRKLRPPQAAHSSRARGGHEGCQQVAARSTHHGQGEASARTRPARDHADGLRSTRRPLPRAARVPSGEAQG